jgi:hypothetical protein
MIDALTTGYEGYHRGRQHTSAAGEPGTIIDLMALEQLLDEELVAQYRSSTEIRDRELYIDELFRRNYARVARWCLRFTADRESAADLAQEVSPGHIRISLLLTGSLSFPLGSSSLPETTA